MLSGCVQEPAVQLRKPFPCRIISWFGVCSLAIGSTLILSSRLLYRRPLLMLASVSMVSSRGFWRRLALPYPSQLQLLPVWLRRFQAIWVASVSVRGLERRDPPFFRRDQGLVVTRISGD